MAEWDTQYIHDLPDAAFAVIEPAYLEGKTRDKRARHLPHHSRGVRNGNDSHDHLDLAHLRNAWQRRKQIQPITDSITLEELIAKAEKHLLKHIRDLDLDWGETVRVGPLELQLSKRTGRVTLARQLETRGTAVLPPQGKPEPSEERPEQEGVVYATVRALSQVLIPDYMLDLRQDGVLERAAPKLLGRTVYPDHNIRVENWLGTVSRVWWSSEPHPPGINAQLKLYEEANPKVVKGLLIDPPAVHSVSVTFWFRWEKSHPEMSDPEFWMRLGEEVQGEPVRIVVTEILDFGEISLVWQGADPHAKVWEVQRAVFSLARPREEVPMEQKRIAELEARMREKDDLIEDLQKKANLAQAMLGALRDEVIALYRKVKGDRAREAWVEHLKKADYDELVQFKQEYEAELEEKFPLRCPRCGAVLTRRSSREEGPPGAPLDERLFKL